MRFRFEILNYLIFINNFESYKKIIMKKILYTLILIASSISLFSSADTIKPYFYLGGYAGANINIHQAGFRELPGIPSCCPKFETGNGIGANFGGLFRLPINQKSSFELKFGYQNFSGKLSKEEFIGNSEIRDAKPPYETIEVVKAISEHSVDANIQAITVNPMYVWHLPYKFRWNIGAQIGYLITNQFSQEERLLTPDNIVYSDTKSRLRNVYQNLEIPAVNKLQAFIQTSISYEIPFGKNMLLLPEVGVAYPLTNVFSDEWKIVPISLTLNLEYPIIPKQRIDTIHNYEYFRDTTIIQDFATKEVRVERTDSLGKLITDKRENLIEYTHSITEHYEKFVPKTSTITGNLVINGKDNKGNIQKNPTLTIEEIEVSESFPLLPYVFFKEGSNDIKATSLELLNPNESDNFETNKLSWETLEIYSNLLNIIKERLDKNPTSRIVIKGTNNNVGFEENNTELSKSRAEEVKNYFINNLGINTNRIKVESQNLPDKPSNPTTADGITENQRAEIWSDNAELLAPVELSQIDKISNPPIIEISPNINSDIGIKDWRITVKQNNTILREYNGNLLEKQQWIVGNEPMPQFEDPIEITFVANDKQGNKFETTEKLNISQKTIKMKREEIKNDTVFQRYSLIVFDFDKSELTANHKQILEKIKDKIKSNSEVEIYGYADRTGNSQYNRDLAVRRIDEVVKFLKIKPENLKKYPIGSDELIFDNDLPEGRSYSRTVKIIIATPIK